MENFLLIFNLIIDNLRYIMPILAAILLVWLGIRYLRHARILADTPTAKIRSCAQGYASIQGNLQHCLTNETLDNLSEIPCCWYRYRIEKFVRQGKNISWHLIEQDTSDIPILIDDSTGKCLLNPKHATDIIPNKTVTWKGFHKLTPYTSKKSILSYIMWVAYLFFGCYRFTEELLVPEKNLNATGMFYSINHEKAEKIEWINNYKGCLDKFEKNQKVNILTNQNIPSRRPYIISTTSPKKLQTSYKIKGIACFIGAMFFISIIPFISSY